MGAIGETSSLQRISRKTAYVKVVFLLVFQLVFLLLRGNSRNTIPTEKKKLTTENVFSS